MTAYELDVVLGINDDKFNKGLADAEQKTKTLGSKIGNAAKVVGAVSAAAVGAGATAIGALVTSSVKAYAQYEQLTGGVETLFGVGGQSLEEYAASVGKTVDSVRGEYDSLMKAQKEVMDNAANAYQTAGMSANEYMETVTSFSASLIASVGGDTAEAAKIADMAIQDMSDNANKMGTSMESIQNAYQGFAKQNYTMLDNLKLGYGGTEKEMQRLLEDAEKLSGVHYDISNLNDVYEAIHVVQTEMGITGTTAKEAQKTIEGSFNMMKASWQNLITGMSDPNADIDTLIDNFMTSIETFGKNVMPVIERALEGVAKLIEKLAPIIADKIPELVPKLVPPLINAATKIVAALVKALPSLIKILVQQIPSIMAQLGRAILSTAPQILGAVIQIGAQILAFIPKLFFDLLGLIFKGVGEILSGIVEFVVSWAEVFGQIFSGLWEGFKVILQSFGEFFAGVWEGIQQVFSTVVDFFTNVFTTAWDAIVSVWSAVTGFFGGIWNGIVGVFNGVASWFSGIFQSAYDAVTGIWDAITGFFGDVWDTIVGIFQDAGVAVGDAISGAVKAAVNAVLSGAVGIINGFISAINVALKVFNAIPGVPNVDLLPKLDAPQLEKGGILEKGQIGILEGNGAEAVVPLDQNRKWIQAVAKEFESVGMGGEDIIIPVYIGTDRIDEIIIKAEQRHNFRNGGIA